MNIFHTILDLEERMFTEDLFQELRTAYEQEPVKNTSELMDSELLDAYRNLQAELEPSQMAELQNLERMSEDYAKMAVPTAFRQGQFTGFQQYFVEDTSKTPYTDFTEQRKMRAPRAMSMRETFAADRLKEAYDDLRGHLSGHLQTHLQKQAEGSAAAKDLPPLTSEELHALTEKALQVIPNRVQHYAKIIGVDYGRITIRSQRTRWGSCSGRGNLSFNCLLMLMPDEIIDSVVVHELCHRKHMNHSAQFYAEVEKAFPDYQRCRKWLKENGGTYLCRLP